MEESIKRVEKLVHATNSALAQMKYSLMFDDLSSGFELGGRKPQKKGSGPKLVEEDLKLCQDEFKSEADDVLAKMNKLFGPKETSHRKHSSTLERIKDINKNLTSRKSGPSETQLSRQKLLTLLSQEFTPGSKTSEDKPPALKLEKIPTPKETVRKSPANSREELKSKILETQEIVDRGFQTARQLSQRMEEINKRTPNEYDGKKSESSGTLKSRCEKCAERRRMKKMKEDKRIPEDKKVTEVKEDNVRIIEMKDSRVPSLSIQRLPSLHIRDGLRMQKVHELQIPSGDTCEIVNTGNIILTHEDIQKEKREQEINQIRLNRLFSDDKFNFVECFNCGKLNKTREVRVDPKKVDDVLRMCNFNVFDPRIDEFVERCNTGERIIEEEPTQDRSLEQSVIEKSHRKTRKLQEMSEYLSRLYEQEADALEDNHLRLDNILQSLFKRVDESRGVFEECLLKRGRSRLSMTKPVTVTLDSTRKKMNKEDIKNSYKSRTPSPEYVKPPSTETRVAETFLLNTKATETLEKRQEDEKEQFKPSSSSYDVKTSKSRQKPSSKIRNASRLPKRSFRKSGKSLPRTKTEKTSHIPLSVVKTPETKPKSPSTTSSSITSNEELNSPKIRQFQSANSFKQFVPFSKIENFKAETVKTKTLKVSSVNRVIPIEEQSPPEANVYAVDPSSEKIESPIIQPDDVKPESDKSPSSSCSDVIKEQVNSKSEKSDDYESDFEGCSEPEVNHKLSTIFEVDSEPEKKQTTISQDTTPTELVTSLKEILSALKDQFTRTETLADKLTENVEEKVDSPKVWPADSELVINLQSARKDSRLFKSPFSLVQSSRNRGSDDLSLESLSEGGSSIGEIVSRRKSENSISENLTNGKRSSRASVKSNVPFELGLNDDVSYSEGEIPSNIVVDSEANSVRSIGEVLSGKTPGGSSVSSNDKKDY